MAAPAKAAPAKGGAKGMILLLVVSLFAGGAGFAVPMLLPKSTEKEGSSSHKGEQGLGKFAFVDFGDVVVNLSEERLTRYLRVKIMLKIDEMEEKTFTEFLTKNKAILKNWVISYLSDKSLQEVSGGGGVNRLRREILEQFNTLLYPGGQEKIRDVLFTEFNVQ